MMNIEESLLFDIIANKEELTQRDISEISGYSLGKVNRIIKELSNLNLINDNKLSKIGMDLFKANTVKNAIILAAGFGIRMIPINNETPKALINIKGEILIERIINQLHSKGIYEIVIVVGYLKEKFEYLIDKYGVKLIINSSYKAYNNFYSLLSAKKYVGDSYIIPGDLYFVNNPFSSHEYCSYYTLSDKIIDKGYFSITKDKRIIRATNKRKYEPNGLAYVSMRDKENILSNLSKFITEKPNAFWEESMFQPLNLNFYAKLISYSSYYEINTFEDLKLIDNDSESLFGSNIDLIKRAFDCRFEDIKNVCVLKKGMTNRSCSFEVYGKKYIMRIPGEGTSQLISRKKEFDVYSVVNQYGLCDKVIYMNPNDGIKITAFYDNSRNCDAENDLEVELCMKKLKAFHDLKLSVNHTFDLKENIIKYETLFGGKSLYQDYECVKSKIFKLLDVISNMKIDYSLCHIDAVPDNFLLNDKNEIKLIDWEYAGMQDPHVDIAMFAIYAGYDKYHIDKIINYYFNSTVDENTRYKIYAYVSICGFLWSNWCEYKYSLGVEFGEYSIMQYRYAKEYSSIALKYFEGENYGYNN